MKAFIFAAGLGTRLRPLTDTMPKALVSVGGRPLLEHAVLKLKESGVGEIMINVHHFSEQIIDFVRSRQSFGVRISFSDETAMLLDTGGGVRKAGAFFAGGEPFFAYNVDMLTDVDLRAMYDFHLQTAGALSTLFVSRREASRYLLFDGDGRLRAWTDGKTGEVKPASERANAPAYQRLAFNGIHVISPEIFSRMSGWPERFSIIDFYLSVAAGAHIGAFIADGSRTIDAGKPEALERAVGLVDYPNGR
jgi:NDP-sugar pyrophosphorylase family protein